MAATGNYAEIGSLDLVSVDGTRTILSMQACAFHSVALSPDGSSLSKRATAPGSP